MFQVGGMKAVVWTDVFQLFFMFLSVLIMVILSTYQAGGAAAVWDRNYQADISTLWTWSRTYAPRIVLITQLLHKDTPPKGEFSLHFSFF